MRLLGPALIALAFVASDCRPSAGFTGAGGGNATGATGGLGGPADPNASSFVSGAGGAGTNTPGGNAGAGVAGGAPGNAFGTNGAGGGGAESGGGGAGARTGLGGGGGGGGGRGFEQWLGAVSINIDIRGGNGGNGASGGGTLAVGGGGGGGGGHGIVDYSSWLYPSPYSFGTLNPLFEVTGGNGGNGGAAGTPDGRGGGGGDGGSGLMVVAPGTRFEPGGLVAGGNGGVSANVADAPHGIGGYGIVGESIEVILRTTVMGGLSGDGVTRSAAMRFTGGTNVLNLEAGAVIIGGIVVDSGSLRISANVDSLISNVISNGGAITFAGGSRVTLTASNTYTGGTTIDAGTVLQLGNLGSTGSIVGGVANNGVLAFARSDGTVFSAVISGTGAVEQISTGTLTLTAANTYTGATSVLAGALIVNGSIGTSSGLTVAAGALVGGTGILPTAVINGTLSPGNSPGTITVNGNLTLGAGSTYVVEVQGATADRTNVTGAATLGGALRLVPLGGNYGFGTRYVVLSAGGGLSGAFASITTAGSFGAGVASTVTSDANNVFLTLTAAPLTPILRQIAPGGAGPGNAMAVATAIDRAVAGGADGSPLLPIYNLPAQSIFSAVNQLSGEVHGAAQGLSALVSTQFLQAMLDPRAPDRPASGLSPMSYAPIQIVAAPGVLAATEAAGPASATWFDTARFRLWASAFASDGSVAGDSETGSARRRERSTGMVAGVDVQVAPRTIVGFALAGGGADATLGNGLGSASAEVFQAGAYLLTGIAGFDISAALAYSRLEIDTNRAVTVLGLSSITGQVGADAWSGRIEARYAIDVGGLSVAPLAALQVQSVQTGAFTETSPGGVTPAAALAVEGQSSPTARSELGARVDGRIAMPGAEVSAYARLAWARYIERDNSVTASLVGLPGSTFTVSGARYDRDSALVATGIDVALTSRLSIGGRFDGEFSDNVSRYVGSARARLAF